MNQRERVARAAAFFETCDDLPLLYQLTSEAAPRARKYVAALLARGDEETIPPPADLRPARQAASRDEALETFRQTEDFALFQVLARAIGRRIEALEIIASAEFPVGARVLVPVSSRYPAGAPELPGTVEQSGTQLTVVLDNGETWEGPPSLARREGKR
jgi:hypothetical protein